MPYKTLIIAEAGVNHNGKLLLAKKFVDQAVLMKADAIKFQTFKTENVISKMAPKATYQKKTTSAKESQFDMVKKLELSFQDFENLYAYCREKKIQFLSSPFDLESVDFLADLGVSLFKIPSGEITNDGLLERVAKIGKPMILSTGMSTLPEIQEALNVIYKTKNRQVTLLHCVTAYPTPYKDANLKAMLTLQKEFNVPVGFSDHTLGIEMSIAAVALGATVIEKHFTLDKKSSGPDHQASLEPREFKQMVDAIRHVEQGLGTGIKKPTAEELKNLSVARKSLIAARDLEVGETIAFDDIVIKRPGNGIPPKEMSKVLGSKVKKSIKQDELIQWEHVV
ncbi:MAG: N-acetylneuraminate synthase [Candidatus Omnitrophota bacterium]|nr:N-acetylneuraminate synthase [Candidatus Omnitrophota bacterium]